MFSKRKLLLIGVLLLVAISLCGGVLLRHTYSAHADGITSGGGCENNSDNLIRVCVGDNSYGDVYADAYVSSLLYAKFGSNCELVLDVVNVDYPTVEHTYPCDPNESQTHYDPTFNSPETPGVAGESYTADAVLLTASGASLGSEYVVITAYAECVGLSYTCPASPF